MPLNARRRIVASALAMVATLALVGTAASTPSASADQPPAPVSSKANVSAQADISAQADTSLNCAKKAKKQANKNKVKRYWTCIGTKARYFKKHVAPTAAVTPKVNTRSDGTFTGVGVDPAGDKSDKSLTKADIEAKKDPIFQDDGRCETVPYCINIKTLYKANGKWNGFYGYRDEVWGRFDTVWEQYFNGASSNYNLELIWDRGYEIQSSYWLAQVRHNSVLPDQVTGERYMYPGNISDHAIAAWYPSQGKYLSTEPTTYKGKHHDDLYGVFFANNRTFYTGTVHLPDFHCPNSLCKYYGPTGPQ